MFTKDEILKTVKELGITFNSFSIDDLITGINIELEHGLQNPLTNITNHELLPNNSIYNLKYIIDNSVTFRSLCFLV